MDTQRFDDAAKAVFESEKSNNGIGTLSEKSMHAVLKRYFEADKSRHEVSICGFIADIANDKEIIEIQTRSLHGMNKKLDAFLENHKVTVVYPVVRTKRIICTDKATGEVKISRSTNRQSSVKWALHEVYHLRNYLANPNFSLCLMYIEADDYRLKVKKSNARKNCICDRFPTKLIDELIISRPSDFLQFLPQNLPCPFTTSDVANLGDMPQACAQSLMYFLYNAKLAVRVGKEKNSYLYRLNAVGDKH